MPTTLVSLISQQPLPNIFLIKEMKNVDQYLFITTELMEQSGNLDHTIKVLGLSSDQYHRVVVKEDNIKDITNKLQELKLKILDQHFIVNLTNGTKIMSIATYNFFQDALLSREIYYLPIGKNQYQQIIPPTNDPVKNIQFKISVKEYLNAYGIEIKNEKFINQVQSKKVTKAIYENYISAAHFKDTEQYPKGILQSINKARLIKKDKEFDISGQKLLLDFLQFIGFKFKRKYRLNYTSKKYLTGAWFEDYIYDVLKRKLRLSNAEIGKGIEIKRKNNQGAIVENELDIVFTYHNQLYVIECKAGLQGPRSSRSSKNVKKSFEEAIYKLKALQSEFGLNPRSFLFTLDPNIYVDADRVNPDYTKRASMHRVNIVALKEIEAGLDRFVQQIKHVGKFQF